MYTIPIFSNEYFITCLIENEKRNYSVKDGLRCLCRSLDLYLSCVLPYFFIYFLSNTIPLHIRRKEEKLSYLYITD